MSPVPIISLQRRLTLVGAIRAGGEKPERGVGRKLESYRLTSARRELIEQAAVLYGGDVSEWQSPTGPEFQTYTEVDELPVLVMPGYSLRQSYELWEGATKRTRMCDGIDEELSGGPCICNASGQDVCDVYTRLVVALPELDTVLGWRLITRGANAAHELPTMMALIEARSGGQTFVPARLRIDQRRGVKDGQVVRFVVPTIDLGASYLSLAGSGADLPPRAQLPAGGFTPAPPRQVAGVDEAIEAVAGPRAENTSTRQSAPMGTAPPPPTTTTPLPVDEAAPTTMPSYDERRQTMQATDAQRKKLNVLVGKLRTAGHVTTEGLYLAIAGRLRNVPVEQLVAEVGGRDEAGELHWAPLREHLLRPEANQLIEWLVAKESRVGAAGDGSDASASTPAGSVPYNEFPPGY